MIVYSVTRQKFQTYNLIDVLDKDSRERQRERERELTHVNIVLCIQLKDGSRVVLTAVDSQTELCQTNDYFKPK